MRDIEFTTLPNGVRVITEAMPHVRSVSVGIWIGTGSRRETPEQNGISHFIEHMLFKGTTNRSAEDIARSVDSIGGNLDAFTAKELVCFNTKVLDQHLPLAFDVLADLVLNPLFRPEDIEKERASFWKRSRWRRIVRTTWSTRSSPPTSGRTIRWASPSSARVKPCAASIAR